MLRTLVRSTVVMTVALLGPAAGVMAQSGEEAAVAQAVEAFRNAMLQADRTHFEALTAEQPSYGHSGGRVETKAQVIDAATSGRSTWKFITLTDHPNRREERHRAAHSNR
jgi:uncharacterized protein DUF4440